jgi:hypothetical protein
MLQDSYVLYQTLNEHNPTLGWYLLIIVGQIGIGLFFSMGLDKQHWILSPTIQQQLDTLMIY